VPEGWVIQDVNNTGSTLLQEATQGYGILAQLCPEEEERQQQLLLAFCMTCCQICNLYEKRKRKRKKGICSY
jgi:hypothetical protein